jgi:hypothetical protein
MYMKLPSLKHRDTVILFQYLPPPNDLTSSFLLLLLLLERTNDPLGRQN